MTQSSGPEKPSSNVRIAFLIFWIAITGLVGVGTFAAILWATGAFDSFTSPAATASPLPPPPSAAIPTLQPTSPPPTQNPDGEIIYCYYPDQPPSGFFYGIQSHAFIGDNDYWMGVVNNLNLKWVKVQLRWEELERREGEIDWDQLNPVVNQACRHGLRLLVSIMSSPQWAVANPRGQITPPDDPAKFVNFVTRLIQRYPGRISAIEVWNEQNLEREWDTEAGVKPEDYLTLLQQSYTAIKAIDPNILVISGGLAPTGVNCSTSWPNCAPGPRIAVMDDSTYLQRFVKLGGLNYADCVGTHSNGTNLPPEADGANPPPQAGYTFLGPWSNPHYSWALASQVNTYWNVVGGQKQLCVTEFGYASPVNGKFPENFGFAADVSEQQQGEFLARAFTWMRDSGKVEGAFLFNLDYGPKGGDPAVDDNVIYSLLYRDGQPRPAFQAIADMPKP